MLLTINKKGIISNVIAIFLTLAFIAMAFAYMYILKNLSKERILALSQITLDVINSNTIELFRQVSNTYQILNLKLGELEILELTNQSGVIIGKKIPLDNYIFTKYLNLSTKIGEGTTLIEVFPLALHKNYIIRNSARKFLNNLFTDCNVPEGSTKRCSILGYIISGFRIEDLDSKSYYQYNYDPNKGCVSTSATKLIIIYKDDNGNTKKKESMVYFQPVPITIEFENYKLTLCVREDTWSIEKNKALYEKVEIDLTEYSNNG